MNILNEMNYCSFAHEHMLIVAHLLMSTCSTAHTSKRVRWKVWLNSTTSIVRFPVQLMR